MKKIKVKLGKRSYPICIGKGLLGEAGKMLSGMRLAQGCYIITNKKIKSIHGRTLQRSLVSAGMAVKFCTVADSEKSKSHATWIKVLKDLASFDKGKGVIVIALGGGVVGDLSGFVAATYRRGVPFVQIPTTLLAQVDSAIGGKVAIDIECAKNLVGAFYQPRLVLSDISTLRTLPRREIRNALAEIIKYGIILDRRLFSYLEKNMDKVLKLDGNCLEHLVSTCSKLKAEVVSIDEYEGLGYRSILNFGHTVGHAAETAISYGRSLSHGEAIAVGMLCAFDIALALNMTNKDIAQRTARLIQRAGLPTHFRSMDTKKILAATSYDKKIVMGKRRWVIPVEIGHVTICHGISPDVIKKAVIKRAG